MRHVITEIISGNAWHVRQCWTGKGPPLHFGLLHFVVLDSEPEGRRHLNSPSQLQNSSGSRNKGWITSRLMCFFRLASPWGESEGRRFGAFDVALLIGGFKPELGQGRMGEGHRRRLGAEERSVRPRSLGVGGTGLRMAGALPGLAWRTARCRCRRASSTNVLGHLGQLRRLSCSELLSHS